jgi:hypothetical protein
MPAHTRPCKVHHIPNTLGDDIVEILCDDDVVRAAIAKAHGESTR